MGGFVKKPKFKAGELVYYARTVWKVVKVNSIIYPSYSLIHLTCGDCMTAYESTLKKAKNKDIIELLNFLVLDKLRLVVDEKDRHIRIGEEGKLYVFGGFTPAELCYASLVAYKRLRNS